MSHQAENWARHDAPMLRTGKGKPDTTARAVLCELAEHADEVGGNSYPSLLHMSWATGYDERTIQRALRRLEAAGLIVRAGTYRGCVRWRLCMDMVRPESDWKELEAASEAAKRTDSARRGALRLRSALAVSGTQNAGHIDDHPPMSGTQNPGQPTDSAVSAEACPARRIPASGTQNPGVRHATPPEPSENLPRTTPGGTLPPDPLRPEDPTASGSSERQPIAINEPRDEPQDVIANHRPRAREQNAAPILRRHWRAAHVRYRVKAAAPPAADERLAVVLPFRSRSA